MPSPVLVKSRIGAGAYAVVYKALNMGTGAVYASKTTDGRPDRADRGAFEREASVVERISHVSESSHLPEKSPLLFPGTRFSLLSPGNSFYTTPSPFSIFSRIPFPVSRSFFLSFYFLLFLLEIPALLSHPEREIDIL